MKLDKSKIISLCLNLTIIAMVIFVIYKMLKKREPFFEILEMSKPKKTSVTLKEDEQALLNDQQAQQNTSQEKKKLKKIIKNG